MLVSLYHPKTFQKGLLIFWFCIGNVLQGQEGEKKVVTAKNLVTHWLQTERLLAHEAIDWQDEQKHTNQLLELYDKELTLLNEELSKTGQNAGLIDEEAETLKNSIAASEASRRRTIEFLAKIKPRIVALAARFPAPLQAQLDTEIATLGETKVSNKTSSAILRAILKILQDASRFNRSFSFDEQEISLKDSSYRAKVMYFGLSRAYFLAGDLAGEMLPGEKQWSVNERSELLPGLKKAFAIQAKEMPSTFFNMPLKK